MKLITNTIEEAKENAEVCLKENFELDPVIDHSMKDFDTGVPKKDVIGSGDSSCKDKINGAIEHKNGIRISSESAKPAPTEGIPVFSDCEDISDGELNLILSDEEENLLNDKDSSVSTTGSSVGVRKSENGPEKISEKILNGCSDSEKEG